MAFALSILLLVSVLGLVLLLGLKRFEMKTGRVLFGSLRPGLRRGVHTIVLFVEYILPFLARRSLAHVWSILRAALLRAVARVTLFIEATLHRMLVGVEQMMQPRRGGQASAFLREVAEHKRELLKSPVQRRAIFEHFQQ